MSNSITKLCRPLIMSPAQKAVLMCLADYAHDDGRDWHSIPAVMAWTCLGRTAVIEALKALEDRGLIAVQRAKGLKSTTFLQLDTLANAAGRANADTKREACDPSGSRTSALAEPVRLAEVTSPAPEPLPIRQADEPVRQTDPKHQEASEKASVKHYKKRTRLPKVQPVIPDDHLPDWLPIDGWKAYLLARAGMRKPMSVDAQILAIKKLGEWRNAGHSVEDILEHSVLCGYQGLFPPRRSTPRRGPLSAEDQKTQSLAKADRILAAMNATGGNFPLLAEVPRELIHG